ncbi:Uncharacterised protein [Mycobacteroides abscessus subsp. abscessus]|nr:Uncharacterised protein [Mycobacteroides abscessus subsp. abscessus]SKU11349.1 Uncharacterised protein [Mycobacteroides abscessus subsp. abscessus]
MSSSGARMGSARTKLNMPSARNPVTKCAIGDVRITVRFASAIPPLSPTVGSASHSVRRRRNGI